MKNIAVFYGGKSVEHDISIITALQVMKAMPKQYNLIPVYITSSGKMISGDNLTLAQTYLDFNKKVDKPSEIILKAGDGSLCFLKGNKIKKTIKIDCALLCNHGHGGEDGSLQGLLEMAEIPYTSCDLTSSALCMDKDLSKVLFNSVSIPNTEYISFNYRDYKLRKEELLEEIKDKVGSPCIIKPASLGSSVGIAVCEDEEKLEGLIEECFRYDKKLVVEEFLSDFREFCCAVIKNGDYFVASRVVEVQKGKIYTFEEKYLSEKSVSEEEISKSLQEKIKKLSIETYKALDCGGVVRVDFLFEKKRKRLYVNEINSIPGSLAFNLFDTTFSDLISTLINEGISRFEDKKNIVYKFNSKAIEKYIEMMENVKIK